MEATLEKLPDDRARLTVEVPAHDIQHAVSHATADLAQSVKLDGFRRGKVPIPVLVQRLGKERIYGEAIDSHIGGWFWNAAAREGLKPAGQPTYDYELPATETEGWKFAAEFPVQPKPKLADWKELEVGKGEVEVPSELVTGELEALQRSVADLGEVDSRAAQPGDVAVLDIEGFGGEKQREVVVELGSERLVEELENGIVGLSAGESKQINYEIADGTFREIDVTLKQLKEKVLPPLDDDFAKKASEFDTADELRTSIEDDLRKQLETRVDNNFRTAVVDELITASEVRPAPLVIDMRTQELIRAFAQTLQTRGLTWETYFQLTGVQPESFERQMAGEAILSIARELVLETAADDLGVEVTDDEIRAEFEKAGEPPEDVEKFMANPAIERVRDDLRLRKALDKIASEVKTISIEEAQKRQEAARTRETIWTPEKDEPGETPKLWTPGDPKP